MKIRIGIALAAILLTIVVYLPTKTLWHNQYDDSYITYRYAVNLAEHGQLAFNLGERTDAASSLLYTVILAAFYRIGLQDLELASFLLNMLAIALIAVFVYSCVYRSTQSVFTAFLIGLIASAHGFISGWAVLGMDTVPFAALLCALTWAILKRKDRLSLILVIAVVFMRLEGLLVVPFWFMSTKRTVEKSLLVAGAILLFYGLRFTYYGTLLPHSYLAKNVLIYYHSQPMKIVDAWKSFAFAAPVMAIIGIAIDKRMRWLGAYIALSATSCLLGPSSDWCRYTIHLFPLMLIAGSPVLKNNYAYLIFCMALAFNCIFSGNWMRHNAAALAPVQRIRCEAGDWLQQHAVRSCEVISGDIGAIAYRAKDMRFIDLFGLTSSDILTAYADGKSAESVIGERRAKYIADTFNIQNNAVVYTHYNGQFTASGKPSIMPSYGLVWGKQCTPTLAVCIAEIN